MYCTLQGFFLHPMSGGHRENRPMTERKTRFRNYDAASALAFVGGFKEANKIFIFIFFFDLAA
jgi:hypothetical protein